MLKRNSSRPWPVGPPGGAIPPEGRAEALARLGGREDLYERLRKSFLESHGGDPELFRKALEEGEEEKARLLIHTLKGLLGTLGARALQETAGIIEALLGEGPEEQVRNRIPAFRNSFRILLEELDRGGSGSGRSTGEKGSLKELEALLQSNDGDAREYFLSHQEAFRELLGTGFQALARALELFDYDQALQALAGEGRKRDG